MDRCDRMTEITSFLTCDFRCPGRLQCAVFLFIFHVGLSLNTFPSSLLWKPPSLILKQPPKLPPPPEAFLDRGPLLSEAAECAGKTQTLEPTDLVSYEILTKFLKTFQSPGFLTYEAGLRICLVVSWGSNETMHVRFLAHGRCLLSK